MLKELLDFQPFSTFFDLFRPFTGNQRQKTSLATLTVASFNPLLGCLQEFNLLRESALRMADIPFIRGLQPADFTLS